MQSISCLGKIGHDLGQTKKDIKKVEMWKEWGKNILCFTEAR